MPYKTNSSTDPIIFPKLESWNPMQNIATIAIDVDKKRVLCRIHQDVIRLVVEDKTLDPMRILKNKRSIFELKAKSLIEDNLYEADGSIEIRKENI